MEYCRIGDVEEKDMEYAVSPLFRCGPGLISPLNTNFKLQLDTDVESTRAEQLTEAACGAPVRGVWGVAMTVRVLGQLTPARRPNNFGLRRQASSMPRSFVLNGHLTWKVSPTC